MKILNKVNNFLQSLTKTQKIILSIAIGYFIYTTYIRVEHFVNKKDDEEKKQIQVKDELVSKGLFDIWAQNLGLETENTLLQKRQTAAIEDNYMKYEGDDKNERKAFAIADKYNKYA